MSDEEKKEQEAAEENKNNEENEPNEGEDGNEDGEPKSKINKKLIIIGSIVFVIILSVPTVLYLLGFFGKSQSEIPENAVITEGETDIRYDEDGNPLPPEQIIYYDLEEFIANLNVGSSKASFLKITISLELPGESQIPGIEKNLPRIRDSFQIYLRELRTDDLQGSAGIYRLREELLLRINKIVYPTKVNDILFKEILIQ